MVIVFLFFFSPSWRYYELSHDFLDLIDYCNGFVSSLARALATISY